MFSDDFVLSDENFMLFAMKIYGGVCLDISDFHDDLKHIKYIKRLINRYKSTGELKERLILNHMILLANVFGPEHTVSILFYKLGETFYEDLKSFLVYIGYMPEMIYHIKNRPVPSSDIGLNHDIVNKLRLI